MSICCFTGCRPDKFPFGFDESDLQCTKLKEEIEREIAELIESGYIHFISGMALGADTFCAEAVLKLKADHSQILLECAVPCKEQSAAWTAPQKMRYEKILSAADKVTFVSQSYSRYCMHKRNAYMADSADMVLAVWNGDTRGGTFNTISYARKKEKPVKIIRF